MSKQEIYIGGADVGVNGALVIVNSTGNVVGKFPMPRIGEKEYDLIEFKRLLMLFDIKHLVIEDVHAVFSAGSSSSFKFGAGKMMIMMGATCLGIPYTLVQSKEWQNEMWKGVTKVTKPTNRKLKSGKYAEKVDTKATSSIAAMRLYPNEDLRDPNRKTERARSLHDGIVDALLMAEFGRRKLL